MLMLPWIAALVFALFLLFALSLSGKENERLKKEFAEYQDEVDADDERRDAEEKDLAAQRDYWIRDSSVVRRQLREAGIKPIKPEPFTEPFTEPTE
jgi:transposase